MARHLFKNYQEMITDQAGLVLRDVATIQASLHHISFELGRDRENLASLKSQLHRISHDQEAFHQRVEKAAADLRFYKSFLASFHS